MSSVDIFVFDLFEFVVDVIVVIWYKKLGDVVVCDEVLVEIEIDKVVLEVLVLVDGILDVVLEEEGMIVIFCQILGCLCEGNSVGKEISVKFEEKVFMLVQCQQVLLEE